MSKRMKDKNKNVKIIFACYNTSYKELKIINILKKQFKSIFIYLTIKRLRVAR